MLRSRAECVFLFLIALLVVAVSVRVARRVARDESASALARWRPQLRQLADGVDISERHHFPNPPVMAVLLEPFAWLPPLPAALAWFYVKAALAAAAVWQVLRAVGAGSSRGVWMLVVVCGLKPILDDLSHGNVNIVILFVVVTALTAYRARRDLLAGGLLGLAIACKLTPALFLPYLAWKRSWRALAGCVVGLALFLYPGVVPAARLGMAENQRQLVSWYRVMVRPYLVEGRVTSEHLNQSLPGLITRLGTDSPSFVGWVGDDLVPLRYDNLLSLSPAAAQLAVRGCLAAFLLVAAWACRPGLREGGRVTAEFGLVTLGMLLFSERTWKHHAVTLILPLGLLIAAAARLRRWRVALAAVVGVTMLLLIVPGLGGGRDRFETGLAPDFAKMAQVYGAYTWAFLLLAGGLITLLRRADFDALAAYNHVIDRPGSLSCPATPACVHLPAQPGREVPVHAVAHPAV